MSGVRRTATTRVGWRYIDANNVSPEMSFLEMLDVVNEELTLKGVDPIHFDHDCREGICGMCSMVINGVAHGPQPGTTVCQLHMRHFKDGDHVYIEPWRARAFPIIKDLVVDRGALDRIMQPEGLSRSTPVAHPMATRFRSRKTTPNARWMPPPVSAAAPAWRPVRTPRRCCLSRPKSSQFAYLPQGQVERERRVTAMIAQMDAEQFGSCTNHYECEAVCPKNISVENIAKMNREYAKALATRERKASGGGF